MSAGITKQKQLRKFNVVHSPRSFLWFSKSVRPNDIFTSVEDTKSMGDIWPLNLRDGGKIEPDILFTEPFRYSSKMVSWVSKHAGSVILKSDEH